jgi:putative transcriptional regulator
MSNHPNRGPKGPQSNPKPAEILAERNAHELTQTEAAALIWCNRGTWHKWEAGERRMHPAFWYAFKQRTAEEGAE